MWSVLIVFSGGTGFFENKFVLWDISVKVIGKFQRQDDNDKSVDLE